MFARFHARLFGMPGQRSSRLYAFVALLLAPMFLQGCTASPPAPVSLRDPANPQATTAPVSYRGVVGPFANQKPAEPASWLEQNQQVAPPEKQ